MSWRAKFLVILGVMGCGVFAPASYAEGASATPHAAVSPAQADKPNKPGKTKKDDKKDSNFTVPIPAGHDATGIRLPSYDRGGQLQMTLAIDVARRLDEDHLQMNKVFLETYNDDGSPEMTVQSLSSVLDLKTRIVTSVNSPTTVQRSDFEIAGKNLVFDTRTRSGKFTGETRTLIYNLSQSAETEKKPAEPHDKQ